MSIVKQGAGGDAGKQNRAEKKARKAIQKLGMKGVGGVIRVTVKKSKVSGHICSYEYVVEVSMYILYAL